MSCFCKGKVVFISHGGGPMPLLGDEGHRKMVDFLTSCSFGKKPAAVLVISAHWEEPVVSILNAERHKLFYDYYGFPPESYTLDYTPRGSAELAEEVASLLRESSIEFMLERERGIDHGVFVPLMLIDKEGSLPVVQLSLLDSLDPDRHLAVGRALRPLLDQDVLIIGSGFSFHNMGEFSASDRETEDQKNNAFQDWLISVCTEKDEKKRLEALASWEEAPSSRYCHPREEHLLPLLVCAALSRSEGKVIFDDYIAGKRTLAFQWEEGEG